MLAYPHQEKETTKRQEANAQNIYFKRSCHIGDEEAKLPRAVLFFLLSTLSSQEPAEPGKVHTSRPPPPQLCQNLQVHT